MLPVCMPKNHNTSFHGSRSGGKVFAHMSISLIGAAYSACGRAYSTYMATQLPPAMTANSNKPTTARAITRGRKTRPRQKHADRSQHKH